MSSWTTRLGPPADFDAKRWGKIALVFFPAFLLWSHFVIGLRGEHFIVSAIFVSCFLLHPKTAWFAYLALPFLAVGIAYDHLRLVIGLRGEIHVADLYQAELAWFGVTVDGVKQILPEYFRNHPVVFLDFICGLAYLAYLAEVIGLAVWLFIKDQPRLSHFAWGFLALNLLGMITYVLWPAAPPWYVEQYGLGPADLTAKPSAAGAARFDELLGIQVFAGFYSRNANVFGAMPSLHCAYPTLAVATVWAYGWRWRGPTLAFLGLVAFSAVYLRHHYLWDVVFGVLYGVATHFLVRTLLARRAPAVSPGTALEEAA